jgi:hypothetical protein
MTPSQTHEKERRIQRLLLRNTRQLRRTHPHTAAALDEAVQRQKEALSFLTTEIRGAMWMLRVK